MSTIILNCDCKHPYQDARYGPGKRVHNESGKVPGQSKCTVCGKVKKS